MSINAIPWVLAAASAVWFGWLAVRGGKSRVLWVLAGGLFGLVSSTCVLGFGQATSIPFSDGERSVLYTEWTLAATAIIVLVGGLFTWRIWHTSPGIIPERNQPGATGR